MHGSATGLKNPKPTNPQKSLSSRPIAANKITTRKIFTPPGAVAAYDKHRLSSVSTGKEMGATQNKRKPIKKVRIVGKQQGLPLGSHLHNPRGKYI